MKWRLRAPVSRPHTPEAGRTLCMVTWADDQLRDSAQGSWQVDCNVNQAARLGSCIYITTRKLTVLEEKKATAVVQGTEVSHSGAWQQCQCARRCQPYR